MTTRYKITQEKDGLYNIQKCLDEFYSGEMNTADLDEILAYQLHADQLVSKTQRMIERLINK
jgi:hypothetical protein